MTARLINREFTVQNGYDSLPPVGPVGAWSAFMNTYSVWEGSSNSITIRRTIELQKGYYYVIGAVDNSGSVNINGQYTINLYNFGDNISRTSTSNNTRIYHPGGPMLITISAVNTGGPRGVAVVISAEQQEYNPYGTSGAGALSAASSRVSVGNLVWSTRSPGVQATGRYTVTMPFKALITVHAWGAGGGGGGMDAGTIGGLGAPGLYNTESFEVNKGDSLEVFVGSAGTGGSSNSGGAPGGKAGPSRLEINGDPIRSFNGGNGTAAGPSPYSGGGGGGGGASGVLLNNKIVVVAGGGAGGGGAGNDGNGTAKYVRRDASIDNNAIGNYNIGTKALDVDTPINFTINAGAKVNTYNYFGKLPEPPTATGSKNVIVFGWGSIPGNAQTRTATTNSRIDLTNVNVLTFFVNRGTESDWGQAPDSGEYLRLEYSVNGSTWIEITNIPTNVLRNTWLIRSPQVPIGAKVFGGVYLRYRQVTQNESSSGRRDTWAMTSIWTGTLDLDFRGEDGQAKGGDGGGAGGGGGGYPGGQGGAVYPGDASGYAGSCGGNYPDNTGATTGADTPYYKVGYSAGGSRGGGNGQNGRVVLLIEPMALNLVKLGGEWKQVQEAFVKVSGAWKGVDSIYVKIDGNWKEINGSGQGDITLAGDSQSYGTSTRSYS